MQNNREELKGYTYSKLREAPKLAKDHTKRGNVPFRYRTGYIRIQKYLNDFLGGFTDNRFIVMPGLRGVGKTTILFQLYNYLINKGVDTENILYLSADELKLYMGSKIIEVIDVFISDIHRTSPVDLEKQLFIFIDESHYDEKWSQAGKILYDKTDKIFFIFTGSSALSLEINVDAARRTLKEAIFPINFSEYFILKYKIFPPKDTASAMRRLIFMGDNDSIRNASKKENELQRKLLKLRKPLNNEWEDYMCCKGFPFGLYLTNSDICEKTFNMVERVIEKDVLALHSFNSQTKANITRILMFLALQKPGETSDSKLAGRLGISHTTVREILNVLEKTQLVFSVKPYGPAGKKIRKAWKYYFLSPSIKAAITHKLGAYDPMNRELLGLLAENLVASYFFRTKETLKMPLEITYDPENGGVDFLLKDRNEKIIPVEVGIGNKGTKQVNRAIEKYNSDYGILVSNATESITKKGDVICIPLTTFSFL